MLGIGLQLFSGHNLSILKHEVSILHCDSGNDTGLYRLKGTDRFLVFYPCEGIKTGSSVYNTSVRRAELPVRSEEIVTFLRPSPSHIKEVFNFPVPVALNHLVLKKEGVSFPL